MENAVMLVGCVVLAAVAAGFAIGAIEIIISIFKTTSESNDLDD